VNTNVKHTGLPAFVERAASGLFRGWYRLTGRQRRFDLIICKVDRLGDWILAEPSIRRLIASTGNRPDAVVVWASRETRELREWRPIGARVEEIRFDSRSAWQRATKLLRVFSLLGQYQARRLVYLRHEDDLMQDLVRRFAQANQLLTPTAARDSAPLPGTGDADVPGQIVLHARLLEAAGLDRLPASALVPDFRTTPPSDRSGPVVLAPFASTPDRNWDATNWVQVIGGLAPIPSTLEIWCSAEQLPAADALARQIMVGGKTTAVSKTGSIPQLADALRHAPLVLAVDSFPAHLAIALDSPAVVLIGGGHFGMFGPWRRNSRQEWVTHPLPCFQCQWACVRPTVECLGLITVDEVRAAAGRVQTASR
jgi:hypothetical protein